MLHHDFHVQYSSFKLGKGVLWVAIKCLNIFKLEEKNGIQVSERAKYIFLGKKTPFLLHTVFKIDSSKYVLQF